MTFDVGAGMRWASAMTSQMDSTAAAGELVVDLTHQMGRQPVDLVLVFFAPAHVAGAESLAARIRERMRPQCLLGVSAHGVIHTQHEHEEGPAVVAIAARLPAVQMHPFILVQEAWKGLGDDAEAFAQSAPGAANAEVLLAFADPFSFDMENFLSVVGRHAPGLRVAGGMASAGPRPGGNTLILNDWIATDGGVALALSGALRADVVVSQGCRPVGPTLRVTRADGNILHELDGMPALERAENVLRELPEKEREPLKNGLYIGLPVRPGASGQGDYLIRNLLGADRERGAIAVGDRVAGIEAIRLHVRDAATAREDLELLLSPQEFDRRASAAFLFSCNSRGRRLYAEPDGDVRPLQDALGGNVPLAGMFCAGEIGPVGDRNRLHGHTASVVIVRPAAER